MANIEPQLEQVISNLQSELAKIRTGRATSGLVEDVKVEAYGALMSVKELGSITVPEPRQLLITAWDKTVIPAIEKALRISGFNPTVAETSIRIVFPPLTGEEREKLVKEAGAKAEEAKIAARVARKDAIQEIEKAKEKKEISEDEYFTQKKQLDESIEKYNAKIEEILKEKRGSIEL